MLPEIQVLRVMSRIKITELKKTKQHMQHMCVGIFFAL